METRKIGDFVELQQGLAINAKSNYLVHRDFCHEGDLPLLRIQDMIAGKADTVYIDKSVGKQFIASEQDIIYTRTGQPGLVFTGFKGVMHNNCFKVDLISDEIDREYFIQMLSSDFVRNQILYKANSSMQVDVTHGIFKEAEIPFIDKEKQIQIGKFLKNIDDKIKNNKRIINALISYVDDLYRYWFIDLNYPNECGLPFSDNHGQIKLIDNREVPLEWDYTTIYENKLNTLVNVGISKFSGEKIYLSTSEVNGHDYDLSVKKVTYDNRESRANMQPTKNSVWFARMKNSVKHISFTAESDLTDKIILSTGFCGLQCSEISFEYIWASINSGWFEKTKDINASGSTQESLTDGVLSYIKILIPSDEILSRFHDLTKDKLRLIEKLQRENYLLLNYKNDNLSKILSED